jgi:OOP family OmpA-OmpF porin
MFKAALRAAAMSLSLAALAACSTDLQMLQGASSQANTDFTRALDKEYRTYAQSQWTDNYDFASSEYFARKGLRVAKGETVAPEDFKDNDWRPDGAVAGDLAGSRQRLVSALSNNATAKAPAPAARAQVMFDCWLEAADDPIFSADNDWKKLKIQICRDEFNKAMAEVDAAMRVMAAPPARSFLVFFDWNKAAITADGQRVIQQAAAAAKAGNVARITATGHADRSGVDRYNQKLSERRAAAVKAELVKLGIPANQIVTIGKGETQPLVPTADGVREPQNRRVEIVLQ